MKRKAIWPVVAVLLGPLPACAQQDSPEAVLADCGGSIPDRMVDSCLERARVLNETNPSTDMQSLEKLLSSRAEEIRIRRDVQGRNAFPADNGQGDGQGFGPGDPGYGGGDRDSGDNNSTGDHYANQGAGQGYGDQGLGNMNGQHPPDGPNDRERYDSQRPTPGTARETPPPPPAGYDQDQGASPDERNAPDVSGAPDDQAPPDEGNADDDQPPPDMSNPPDDGGPPDIDPGTDPGPPPDAGPHK